MGAHLCNGFSETLLTYVTCMHQFENHLITRGKPTLPVTQVNPTGAILC